MSEREEHEWKALSPRSAPRFVATRRLRSGDPETFYLSDGYALRSDFARDTEILRLASEVATLRKERDEAREVALDLIHLAADAAERRNGDWACAECRPHSDMLKEGWSCSYHRALAFRARIASREGEEPGPCAFEWAPPVSGLYYDSTFQIDRATVERWRYAGGPCTCAAQPKEGER